MKILVPATSANLGPGFDCLGLSLKYFNQTIIEKSNLFSISIYGEGSKNIYLKKNNVFVNIFNEIYQKLNGKKQNFRFIFHNNIPLSRGMGSSSAVIVAAIACAYELSGFKIDKNNILNEALKFENHPDNIAPAVLGGFVCSMVHNEKVLAIKKKIDENLRAIITIPNVSMNTQKSRSVLAKKINFNEGVFNICHSSFLTACFLEKKYDLLKYASLDKLHQEQRMKNLPELFQVQKISLENNALMSTLSGSGSSFFTLAYEEDAKNIQVKLKNKFNKFRVELLDFDDKGFKFC
ncbi:homoserine kinase [Campylobacter insulaenigrae]|uniref:Homoserine kinase n=1 Tax=Campylobacter insulaenigrae TaxID=260714 RepID=A0ABY3G543_9BACT|nr:homoserine kinase [Campylobacter insulaenigrae]MCR6571021.1 homoserine kinase [Campylobacter insulaenigrae]MCR6572853.1 homoserine kinase [Campylobacter insulaenigrae]MCR6574483.1 homoserine kinase [Campylobacter insulaenigrae]MCR6576088.1 homoserine kinase [Campylobacter insulaenigrae]MCR6577607.1 homoserine kinase [Campylobacter insulaenigrae]